MKVILTVHVKKKLETKEAKLLKIGITNLIHTLKKPVSVDKNLNPHRSVGKLNNELSLAVIWKIENGIIKVITFYPAERGRYEGKILQRR